jgi:hypothetical protein
MRTNFQINITQIINIMNNKFKIIETLDYILEVSENTPPKSYKGFYYLDGKIFHTSRYCLQTGCKEIIAHKPKGNAPELDLPLISEMVVEDDVEKFACNIYNLSYEEYLHIREHVSQTRESVEAEYEHLGLEIPNKYFDVISFITGYNHRIATKVYSEEDMIDFALWRSITVFDKPYTINGEFELWKSLNQAKTWVRTIETPVLSEIVVEDDIERLAKEYSENKSSSDVFKEQHKVDFIAGYKSATKVYSEEDLDKAIDWALENGRTGKVTSKDIDNFIQSLNQR